MIEGLLSLTHTFLQVYNVFVLGNLSDTQTKEKVHKRILSKVIYKGKFLFPSENESYESMNPLLLLPRHTLVTGQQGTLSDRQAL